MSPISVEFKLGNKGIKLPDIPTGGSGSFTDHDPIGATVITALCNDNDDGGIVYRQPASQTLESMDKKLRIVQPRKGEAEIAINKDETLSIAIQTRFGKGILKLRQFSL